MPAPATYKQSGKGEVYGTSTVDMNLFRFEESLRVELGVHLIARQRNDPPLAHMIPPTEKQVHNTTVWVCP